MKNPNKTRQMILVGAKGGMGQWFKRYLARDPDLKLTAFDAKDSEPLILESVKSLSDHDTVILATPISVTSKYYNLFASFKPRCIIADICSIKGPLEDAINRCEKAGLKIAPVHPMFGPSATEGSLKQKNLICCELADNDLALEQVSRLFAPTGINIINMPLCEHDQYMAYSLALPHLLNIAFAETLRQSGVSWETLLQIAGTTLQDQLKVTRNVVCDNQDLYFDIQRQGAYNAKGYTLLKNTLNELIDMVHSDDKKHFTELMEAGSRLLNTNFAERKKC